MNKRTLFIYLTAGLFVLMTMGVFFISNFIKKQLVDNLTIRYGDQELLIAKQVGQALELEIQALQRQLYFISEMPEIRSGDQKSCTSRIEDVYRSGRVKIGNIGRVDKDGFFKCSINKAIVGVRASNLGPYITDIFNDPDHNPVMSRVLVVPGVSSRVIAIHVPVFNSKGEFDGTVGGAIYLNDLVDKYITSIQFAKDGYISLYDDDGTIIYNYKTEFIGKNLTSPEFQSLVSSINTTDPQQTLISIKEGQSSVVRFGFDNQEKIGAYVPVNVFPNRKWRVSVSVPISTIHEQLLSIGAEKLINRLVLILSLIVMLSLSAFLFVLLKKIFNPILILEEAAQKISAGDLDSSVPIKGNDEIGKLSSVFNLMTRRLKSSYTDLEQKVIERTKDLEKFKQAVDSSTDGVIFTDKDFNIIYMNPTFEKMSGQKFSLLSGKKATDYLTSKQVSGSVNQNLLETATSGKTFTTDDMILFGSELPVRLSIYPLMNDGKPEFYVALSQDISKLKEIDRAKTEFVSLASHQLRTPLTAINWYAEMLLSGDAGTLTEDQKKYLEEIYNGNQRMVDLINSLLNVSRLELGTFSVYPEDMDIVSIAKDVVKETEPQVFKKRIDLREEYASGIPIIKSDPKLVRIVIQNLLSNAVKYTPEEGRVDLSIAYNEKQKDIIIKVTDTGYGIPKNQQDKIFTKLFRADNARTMEVEGTGLGLYIVKAIVDYSDGDINFDSVENKGTTFNVRLPIEGMQKKEGTRSLDQ